MKYVVASMLFVAMLSGFVYVTALITWVHAKYDHLPGPKRPRQVGYHSWVTDSCLYDSILQRFLGLK